MALEGEEMKTIIARGLMVMGAFYTLAIAATIAKRILEPKVQDSARLALGDPGKLETEPIFKGWSQNGYL